MRFLVELYEQKSLEQQNVCRPTRETTQSKSLCDIHTLLSFSSFGLFADRILLPASSSQADCGENWHLVVRPGPDHRLRPRRAVDLEIRAPVLVLWLIDQS